MDYKSILDDSLATAVRMKRLLIFFAATHLVFLAFGEWTVATGIPSVMEFRAQQLEEIKNLPYLQPLTGVLAGNLPLKILYTFLFNLIFGAFVSTTLVGAVFFMPYLIAVWRGFLIGVLFYGMDHTLTGSIVFYGTFLLEFGAYTISSAVGTDIGLSLLVPSRKGTDSRRVALVRALKDGKSLYVMVIILLAIGAVWEMGWLHYIGDFARPGLSGQDGPP